MTIPLSNQRQPREEPLPELQQHVSEPRGLIRRNLKLEVYLGIAVLFIIATAVSSLRHKPVKQPGQVAPPLLQDSNANIEEIRRNLESQQRQAAAASTHAPPQDAANATPPPLPPYFASETTPGYPCVSGQPCPAQLPYAYQAQQQLSPQEQETLQLAQQERELAYKARFASNLAYSQSHAISGPSSLIAAKQPNKLTSIDDIRNAHPGIPTVSDSYGASSFPAQPYDPSSYPPSNVLPPSPRATPLQQQSAPAPNNPRTASEYKRAAEVNINSATGQPYVVYEGTLIETALMNRLDGDASGPVKVLVTNPVYSHDHQHVLIPDGTVVLGESRKLGGAGFGQQRRLAVVFHRMIMPDGYSVDLDQFQGLNQVGETGLKDKVNNHYFQIFGASIALGIIAGGAEASNNGGTLTANGGEAYKYGVASSLSQSATTVLDQFINIPPTITIREGHRIKVYITQDLLLPAYENHSISASF